MFWLTMKSTIQANISVQMENSFCMYKSLPEVLERKHDGVKPLEVDTECEEDWDGPGGVEHPEHWDHDWREDVFREPRPNLERVCGFDQKVVAISYLEIDFVTC